MTEENWLASTDPDEFLRAVARVSECPQDTVPQWLRSISWKLTGRKLRFFAVGCCLRLQPRGLLDPRYWRAIDAVETHIRLQTKDSRKRLSSVRRSLIGERLWLDLRDPAIICAMTGSSAARVAAYTSWQCRRRVSDGPDLDREEGIAQFRLLRDVLGNPFRPVAFSETWRTPSAVALAETMHESRNFDAMPVLADSLEAAGCDEPAILSHCRDPEGVHIRGCWVADLVLEKA